MCNFHGYDNARSRRNERRRARQEAYKRNKALNMALKAALNPVKPSKQQTISNTKLPILSLKRKGKVLHRVEIALLYNRVKVYDSFDNCCLPKTALYSVKTKRHRPILPSGEVTARI
ncbi:MAG: hypothetical protein ACL7BU_09365 [Candidatus Phlomobacter fragariae]